MKRVILFCTIIAILVVLAAGTAGTAMAEGWTWMHGSAAEIESTGNTNWWRVIKQGLDLDLKHGKTTLVHIGVQTPIMAGSTISGAKADKIRLMLYTGSSDIKVTKVYLYMAGWQAQAIDVDIQSTSTKYFWAEVPIDSSYAYTYGLGISLEVAAGTNSSLEHRFCLATAGVHWIGSTTSASSSEDSDAVSAAESQAFELTNPTPPPPPRKPWR